MVLESPGSLTFEVDDVPGIAAACRRAGVLTLLDNTWAAGVLFKPLDHGVDLSMQALTKYAAGHADVFMGSVAVRDDALAQALDGFIHDTGSAVSPDDAYTVLRGLRTLPLRLERHGEAGLEVARWLQARPEVARVLHPAPPRLSRPRPVAARLHRRLRPVRRGAAAEPARRRPRPAGTPCSCSAWASPGAGSRAWRCTATRS